MKLVIDQKQGVVNFMNILVCIKQVPGTNKVEVDEETGVLKRDGVSSKMNPYDLYAIETALRIREKTGGTITAVTMGPPQAEAVIKEAYMMVIYSQTGGLPGQMYWQLRILFPWALEQLESLI